MSEYGSFVMRVSFVKMRLEAAISDIRSISLLISDSIGDVQISPNTEGTKIANMPKPF